MEPTLYEEVARILSARIQGMRQGERLPSVRQLADSMQISRSTAIAAYRVLEQAGLCYARPRSGMFALPAHTQNTLSGDEPVTQAGIDLMSGVPGADAFPFAAFKQAISDVLDDDQERAFTYQPGCGYEGLREAIAAMMTRRGAPCQAANVLVTSGAQQALDIAARFLLARDGASVCMENPSYPGAQAVFAAQGAHIIGIPADENGMDLTLLEGFVRRAQPALVYTMPLLQTPTTACMPQSHMERLCALAQRYNFMLLEEDVVSELLDTPRTPLYAIAPERVIHIKSFSKIMMPGIRTGFLLAPPSMVEALDRVKRQSELSAAGLIQRALCRLLNTEQQERHVQSLRKMFATRRATALAQISHWSALGVECRLPPGGVDFWLRLPDGVRDTQIAAACRAQDVLVGAGSRYYCAPMANTSCHIRLSVAATGGQALDEGLAVLRETLRQAASKQAGKLYIE